MNLTINLNDDQFQDFKDILDIAAEMYGQKIEEGVTHYTDEDIADMERQQQLALWLCEMLPLGSTVSVHVDMAT